jgi:DNA replication protein DnaC
MITNDIHPDLRSAMRRLRLGRLLDTLPERLALARQQKQDHGAFLLSLLGTEVSRRDSAAVAMRADRAGLDPDMRLENWDPTSKVKYDQALLNDLVSLAFIEARRHVTVVGPVGVGKTFLAHSLGHAACRAGYSVLAVRVDRALKTLRHSRLDNSYEAELRKLIAVDLLILDDLASDPMDQQESRDIHEIFLERDRAGSIIATSNRGPDEWLPTFADPVRAQAAVDRFTGNSFDLVIDGESYRRRLKPKPDHPTKPTGQRKRGQGK